MGLAPIGLPKTGTDAKSDFVKNAGTDRTVKVARRRGFSLDQDTTDYVKVMTFGVPGSGKTYLLGQLLELGLRVAVVTTDIGDTGHITIKNYLKSIGRLDLASNIVIIPLEGYGEVTQFIRKPWDHPVEVAGKEITLGQFDPDLLAWDGFGSFQQLDINEYVGDMTPTSKSGKSSEHRESGLILETQDWNAVKNATMRKANDFLSIRKLDGRPVHKWFTCHESLIQKPVSDVNMMLGTKYEESYKPMLQGQGGQMILAGFDVIMRNKVVTRKADDGAKREYTLVTAGSQNLVAKNRGFNLKEEMPADMRVIWPILMAGPAEKPLTETASSE